MLPAAYTCTATMPVSPAVSWENVPAGAKTLTLIAEDPDAPSGTYTHWIVYNIPPSRGSIPGGITAVKEIDGGGQQGDNTAGDHMFGAACPPIGSSHRYIFTLYAVDYTMGLPTTDRDGIDTMLNGHTIGEATIMAHFSR
jgi:Raf kinase inhibitor-like YbhB/YbcL family protein